jgi:hypothetical protein
MGAVSIPPTRILSWQQAVIEADPNWSRLNQRPTEYVFSNGRQFQRVPASSLYTLPQPIAWDGPVPWDTPGVTWGA